MDIDTVLMMDRAPLISILDQVRPDWHIQFADDAALRDYTRAVARGAHSAEQLKHRTLDRLNDVLWLLGHSALQVEAK